MNMFGELGNGDNGAPTDASGSLYVYRFKTEPDDAHTSVGQLCVYPAMLHVIKQFPGNNTGLQAVTMNGSRKAVNHFVKMANKLSHVGIDGAHSVFDTFRILRYEARVHVTGTDHSVRRVVRSQRYRFHSASMTALTKLPFTARLIHYYDWVDAVQENS